MTKRTIADEARELYDLATLLALDVAAQLVVSGRGGTPIVSKAMGIATRAKELLGDLDGSDVGGAEIPDRLIDAAGCGAVIDAMLAGE